MSSAVANPQPEMRPLPLSVLVFLLINFFTFPFFLRNVSPAAYTLLWGFALIAIFALGMFQPAIRWHFKEMWDAPWKQMFCCLYLGYLGVLFLATAIALLMRGETQTGKDLAARLMVYAVAVLVCGLLSHLELRRFFSWYVHLVTGLSVLGILLVILLFFHRIPLLSHVEMSNGSIRDFYGIGYVWHDIWVGSIFGWERLQSFSDEAGTFAFALLPAVLLSFEFRYRWQAAILLAAMMLTFSVGAWIVLIAIGIYAFQRHSRRRRWIAILAGLGLLVGATYTVAQSQFASDFMKSYLSSKLGDTDEKTSVGDRIDDLKGAYSIVLKKPLGVGISGYKRSELALAIGWLIPAVEGGVIGFAFYLGAFFLLIWKAGRSVWKCEGLDRQLGLVLLALAFAGLQRSGMDSTVWHWTWLLAFLKSPEQAV